MSDLRDLAALRSGEHAKNPQTENFLERMNAALAPLDQAEYADYPLEHPFFFVIGLPRSGTTFTTQFLAQAFDLAYVNNLAARFYRAPLQGLRLSEALLGKTEIDFQSQYARTEGLGNIHEFGYFWRHWLHKGDLGAMERLEEDEARIDWDGLRRCLSTLQNHWGRASVFKNIFGAYHLPKFMEVLKQKLMVVYIERDELDVAVSIYRARERYYGAKMETWWSYTPPEVKDLLKLPPEIQIAGQIRLLKRFYQKELEKLPANLVLKIPYHELTAQPGLWADRIAERTEVAFAYQLERKPLPARGFETKSHREEKALRDRLQKALEEFETKIYPA